MKYRTHTTKAAALLLAAMMILCLAACGGDTPVTTTASPETAATKAVIDITTAEATTEAPTEAPTTEAPTTETAPTETEAPTEAETTEAPTEPTTEAPAAEPFGEEDLTLTVDGVDLSLGIDFAPLAGQIYGGVYDEQVGQACVGGGNDRAYYYGGDEICIYTVGSASGAQTIYDIFIDGVQGYSTAKGAVIGASTRDQVIAIYGEPSFSSLAADRYSIDAYDLIFSFDDYDILDSVGLHDNAVQ